MSEVQSFTNSLAPFIFALMATERALRVSSNYLEVKAGLRRPQAATSRNTFKIPGNLEALVLGKMNWILCSEETMHHFATSCGFAQTGAACLGRSVSAIGEDSAVFNPAKSASATGHSGSSQTM